MEDIHDRMPLVLPKDSVSDWLENDAAAMHILHGLAPMLEHHIAEEAQLTLPI